MSKTVRIALVSALLAGTFVFTILGSQIDGDEVMITLNFWSLVSLPIIAVVGYWWIRKAK